MSCLHYYNYGIKHILTKNLESIQNVNSYGNVNLIVYKVNIEGKMPFLEFLLTNNGYNLLTLPKLTAHSLFNNENIITYSQVYLSGILQSKTFNDFSKNVIFDGFYEFNKDLYLFMDISKCEINIDETYLANNVRFGIIDEIVNHKNICDIPIDYNTSLFFIQNESISYLYNTNNVPYEVPVVGFVGKPTEQKLNFVRTFGESAKNKSAIMGPYFYFTNFRNAIRQGGWSHNYKPEKYHDHLVTDDYGKYKKGGLIRFALFVGHAKYVENAPNDPIDESEMKKQKMVDDELDKKREILTLRITDHDGNWSKTYDSVYLGKLELDDGSFLEEAPFIVLKEYEQQVPLSIHFIDRTTLGEKYEEHNRYYSIM